MDRERNKENPFGRESVLQITTGKAGEDTYLKDLFFTAPFKVMTPFEKEGGKKEVMVLTASAGIMEGDAQRISIHMGAGTELSVTSQAFEKIHRMKDGFASRKTKIRIEKGSSLSYCPLPVIPFADSAFKNHTSIYLEDESSRLIYEEIVSCGRAARGERFRYRFYHSGIEAWCREKMIYRENIRYTPSIQPMEETGFFEGYSHMASLLFFHFNISEETENTLRRRIEGAKDAEGGITRTGAGDIAVRIFGNRAQRLQELCRKLRSEIQEISEKISD